ncbi:MAG: hypothetical protein ACREYE_18520, partial [Gammaproteobacteria bacterium]
ACAGVPARIFAATISCPSCTPKAATDDIKNLSGIHAGLPEGHSLLNIGAGYGLIPSSTERTRCFGKGCMHYELIPTMPEERLRPLMQRFAEMLLEHRTFSEVFGYV